MTARKPRKPRTFKVWIFTPSLRKRHSRFEGYRRFPQDKPGEWKSYEPATLTLDAPKKAKVRK